MVYCGKPSKGCSSCRERKIRCDEKEPSCGQCEKRRQTCPGYRNLTDLRFRNETYHVINRATKYRRRASPKPAAPPPACPTPRPSDSSLKTDSPALKSVPTPKPRSESKTKAVLLSGSRSRRSICRRGPVLAALTPMSDNSSTSSSQDSPEDDFSTDSSEPLSEDTLLAEALLPSLQEQGTAFFFSRYVGTDSGCHQNYSFIYDVWKPPDSTTLAQIDAVTVSMTAVGLAGLSKLTGSTETMTRARQSYGIALQLTHAALRDAVEAVKDTTLLAVLLLGIYEAISGRTPHTAKAWQDHVNGAAALASMRGSAQFRSRAGVRMFLMLSHSVLVSCIQSELPMPQAVIDLRNELNPKEELDVLEWRFLGPVYRALQVRHDVRTGKLQDMDETLALLSDIDDEFAAHAAQLPPSWSYRRIQMSRSEPNIYGNSCLVYSGLVQANTWNDIRAMRMMVLETILQQLHFGLSAPKIDSLTDEHQRLLAKTMKSQEILGEAIAASIPQYFGLISFRDSQPSPEQRPLASMIGSQTPYGVLPPSPVPGSPSTATQSSSKQTKTLRPAPEDQGDEAERFMTLASASHTIIWPLYILGTSTSCSHELKQYAIRCLHAVHREADLEQARIIAGLLSAKPQPPVPPENVLHQLPPFPENLLPEVA